MCWPCCDDIFVETMHSILYKEYIWTCDSIYWNRCSVILLSVWIGVYAALSGLLDTKRWICSEVAFLVWFVCVPTTILYIEIILKDSTDSFVFAFCTIQYKSPRAKTKILKNHKTSPYSNLYIYVFNCPFFRIWKVRNYTSLVNTDSLIWNNKD